jgi:hypothetical protein
MIWKLLGVLNIWRLINNKNDETEEMKARILAANKAYSFLQSIFRSKSNQNKIRFYKTLIKPVLCFGSVTWTLTHMIEQILCTFEMKT